MSQRSIYVLIVGTISRKNVNKWQANLGFPTKEVKQCTLFCTTRYVSVVEAKTREYMRDHFKSHITQLRPH